MTDLPETQPRKPPTPLLLLYLSLAVATLVSITVATTIGAVPASITDITRTITSGGTSPMVSPQIATVIWDIRLPRVLLAATTGAGLAITGVILQALVRNSLADPYILGLNSGASVGAAAAMLFGVGAVFGDLALQASAFIGAAVAALIVFLLIRSTGAMSSLRLLMAGVAAGYILSAITNFLIFASDNVEGTRSVMFWMLGSLATASMTPVLVATIIIVTVATAVLIGLGKHLDALAIGDDTALAVGINPERLRGLLLIIVCALVGSLVALTGSIGFIGLVIPHVARRITRRGHRVVISLAGFIGSIVLIWSDVIARTLLAPQEIPIGIITAILGAPFLLILIRRMHANT